MGNKRIVKVVQGEKNTGGPLVMIAVPPSEAMPDYQPLPLPQSNAPYLQPSQMATTTQHGYSSTAMPTFADIVRLNAYQTILSGAGSDETAEPSLSALTMSVYINRIQRARRMLLEHAGINQSAMQYGESPRSIHISSSGLEAGYPNYDGDHAAVGAEMTSSSTQTPASLQRSNAQRGRRSLSDGSSMHYMTRAIQPTDETVNTGDGVVNEDHMPLLIFREPQTHHANSIQNRHRHSVHHGFRNGVIMHRYETGSDSDNDDDEDELENDENQHPQQRNVQSGGSDLTPRPIIRDRTRAQIFSDSSVAAFRPIHWLEWSPLIEIGSVAPTRRPIFGTVGTDSNPNPDGEDLSMPDEMPSYSR